MMMMKTDMIVEIIVVLLLLVLGISLIEAVEMSHERPTANSASATSTNCPKGCHCSSSDVLDCVGKNFTQPPIPIEDSKASDLLLADNKIAQIDLVFLKHYPSLRLLSLSDNGLR